MIPGACPTCGHNVRRSTNPVTKTCSSAGLQGSTTARCGCDHRDLAD